MILLLPMAAVLAFIDGASNWRADRNVVVTNAVNTFTGDIAYPGIDAEQELAKRRVIRAGGWDELSPKVYSVGGRFKKIKNINTGTTALIVRVKDTLNDDQQCAAKIGNAQWIEDAFRIEVNALRDLNKFAADKAFPVLIYPSPVDQTQRIGAKTEKGVDYEFFVMTLVGPDMLTLLVRRSREGKRFISVRQALRWILQIEQHLRKLHLEGMAHNDIHTANFCLHQTDMSKAVLIDLADITRFNPNAMIRVSKRGAYKDYIMLFLVTAKVFAFIFGHEKEIKERFPSATTIEQMEAAMMEDLRAVAVHPDVVFANAAALHKVVGDKFVQLLKHGLGAKKAWFNGPHDETGPITSWTNDEEEPKPLTRPDSTPFFEDRDLEKV